MPQSERHHRQPDESEQKPQLNRVQMSANHSRLWRQFAQPHDDDTETHHRNRRAQPRQKSPFVRQMIGDVKRTFHGREFNALKRRSVASKLARPKPLWKSKIEMASSSVAHPSRSLTPPHSPNLPSIALSFLIEKSSCKCVISSPPRGRPRGILLFARAQDSSTSLHFARNDTRLHHAILKEATWVNSRYPKAPARRRLRARKAAHRVLD